MKRYSVVQGVRNLVEIPPLPIPFNDSKWGKVIDWSAPIPGVYRLVTERDTGKYVVDRTSKASLIPESVFSYGESYEDGRYVYFDSDSGRYVLEYELALYQSNHCLPEKRQTFIEDALTAALLGAVQYPEYFGELTPQHRTPWGRLARYIKVDNGAWFIQAGGTWALDVSCEHCVELNEEVRATSKSVSGTRTIDSTEDMYWELEDCAPAVWELLEYCPGLNGFLTSINDLFCCLCEIFPAYVQKYNEPQDNPIKITKREGSSITFLKLPI